jgi:16S rRNA (guanine527-N7)-methyltransferase
MTLAEQIAAGIDALGLRGPHGVADALARHVQLVLEANAVFNLTSISPEDAASLHVLDSLTALPFLEAAPPGVFADIGSGAGFPGIPLAMMSGRPVALVESVGKKADFLVRAVADLRLDATVHRARAEELAQTHPESFSAVTARALSSLPSLVELSAPLLLAGGLLVCLKGQPPESELEGGRAAAALCGMREDRVEQLSVPGTDARRCVVVYRRVGSSQVRLPRRPGMAQRKPLA